MQYCKNNHTKYLTFCKTLVKWGSQQLYRRFMTEIAEGIYFDMPESEYHNAEGLSCSGMKILRVSPYHYWWESSMNPARPERDDDSAAKTWGKAFHKIMLEPQRFDDCYAASFEAGEGLLKTVDDMKEFCLANEIPTKGLKKKDDWQKAILEAVPNAPFYELEKEKYLAANIGKEFLSSEGLQKLKTMSYMATLSPNVKKILDNAVCEVSIFVKDPETGIMLKARMDAIKPNATLDLKTFSNQRGKPIQEAARDAISGYFYNFQYVVYSYIRKVASRKIASGEIVVPDDKKYLFADIEPAFAFILTESDAPHYTYVIEMRSGMDGAAGNLYFSNAWEGFRKYVNLYKDCLDKYGKGAWLLESDYEVLEDEKIPNIMYQTY